MAFVSASVFLKVLSTCALGTLVTSADSGQSDFGETHCTEPVSATQSLEQESSSLLQSRTVVSKSDFQLEGHNEASPPSSLGTCGALKNQGSHFTVPIDVGTPPQRFDVVADTGSNAVIVSSCICQHGGHCSSKDRCFRGTNRSSSFAISRNNMSGKLLPSLVSMTFGSGSIQAAVATDIVSVGSQSARMNQSLLLMVARALRIYGPFEGILGLGLPNSNIGNMSSRRVSVITEDVLSQPRTSLGEKQSMQLLHKPTPGFLEQAKIPRFSVCFNDGADGVLRLAQPPMSNMLGAIGTAHWALDFGGVSVGEASQPSLFCSRESMHSGQTTPCAAIPDSGTTVIMAPKAHLQRLFAELCGRWPRCKQHAKSTSNHSKLSLAFQEVLLSCTEWVNASHGLDQELPPLHFHVTGANGTKRALKLGGADYILETMHHEVHYVKKLLGGIFPVSLPVSTKQKVCTPAFGAMAYNTVRNGPVWILGLPIFYKYQVGYELKSEPPGISFSQEPCGSCGPGGLVEQTSSVSLVDAAKRSQIATRRQARIFRGPPRLPNIDVNKPL